MRDPLPIEPLRGPLDAEVQVPGSKSITNRALLVAGLAEGTSTLHGALAADDTEAMRDAIAELGATVLHDETTGELRITGVNGQLPSGARSYDARQSGTTARFLLAVLATSTGSSHLTGDEQLLGRPMPGARMALQHLGARVEEHGAAEHLPLTVHGGGHTTRTALRVRGDVSSQLVSGLLLAGALLPGGLELELEGHIVSRPYLDLTLAVQETFGVQAAWVDETRLRVEPGNYKGAELQIEPDASAASYFFAAPAMLGGRVRVRGLGPHSLQGDARFVQVLESMGADVRSDADGTEVRVGAPLRGVEVDLRDLSDTAPTLAVLATTAISPTRITGIGFIRAKESDRVADMARELRRCGIRCDEEPDGLVIHPGIPRPTVVQTYRDHRVAMSFALLGLVHPGMQIQDPGCVAKTFPTFFSVLASLAAGGNVRGSRE